MGELGGGGDIRGLEGGPRTKIFHNRVEVKYTDRKTSDTLETVTLARNTLASNLDAGQDFLDLASAWGREVVTIKTQHGVEQYKYIDYYVLRLSLHGLLDPAINLLKEKLDEAPEGHGLGFWNGDGQKIRDALKEYATRRVTMEQGKCYINVAEGTREELSHQPEGTHLPGDRDLNALGRWWREQGFEVELNPGPLLCTTIAGSAGRIPLMMPYTPGSLAANLRVEFMEAYEQVLAEGLEDEVQEVTDLPVGLHGVPKWNSHSGRRGGAKHARYLMNNFDDLLHPERKTLPEDINVHFGWLEEALRGGKARQVAYASTTETTRRTAVTIGF